MGRLEGTRAVITGAASGIGEETARLFVAEGASVVLADIDGERGPRIAAECGDRARFIRTDVSEEADVDGAVALAVEEFGGLDCMFNNAGNPGSIGGITDIEMAVFDRTVAIHLRGVFLGIRAAARVMRPQGHGSIINTSSVAGLAANYGGHDYSACKAAIAHLTRTAASELGESGIRVNAICPGGVATVDTVSVALADMAPIRRSGQPIDIAEAALWLAGGSSSFVSGQALAVDGGLTTGPLYREQWAKVEGLAQFLLASGT